MKYKVISVAKATIKSSNDKSLYEVYYNLTLGNTFTAAQLHVPAIDELDAYCRACRSIEERADKLEEIIEKREQQDV